MNVLGLEAPRLRERQVVVGPATHSLPHGLGERLAHDRAELLALHDRAVDIGQLGGDLVDDRVGIPAELVGVRLDEGLDRVRPLKSRVELPHVDVGQAVEEVEVGGVRRRRGHERADAEHTIAEQRPAGKRVWSPSRAADDGELVEPERIRDRRDIRGCIRDRAARIGVREPVPGPVVGDHPDAVPLVERGIGMAREPAAGRSMVDEHSHTVGNAPLDVGQRPSVRGCGSSPALHARDHTGGPARRT